MKFHIRKAAAVDVPRLREVIDASVRGLQSGDYSPAQIAGALQSVYGVDSQLIADGTYLVAEVVERGVAKSEIVACGGWSRRKTLYGGDQYAQREDSLLDPERDAAKIRAFFVHPDWARRGIGTLILEACENAARDAGFTRAGLCGAREFGSTSEQRRSTADRQDGQGIEARTLSAQPDFIG